MANIFQPKNLVEERTSPQRETPGSITEREIPLSRSLLAWSHLKKIGKNIVLNVWTRFEITLRQRLEIREIFPWSEDAFLISVTAIWVKLRKCSISDGRRHLLKTFLLKDSDLFTAESGEIKLSVGEKQIYNDDFDSQWPGSLIKTVFPINSQWSRSLRTIWSPASLPI